MPYPRGSQWRRWDLHVHTPESFAWQAGDWDQYVNALERVEGVSVLGITDYLSIDGYKKILDYRKKGRLRNFDLILPNIEFRLSCLVPARGSADNPRRVNFHVVFSDEVPVEEIEEQFIHVLSFTYDGDTSGGESRSLTRRAIEDVGELLKKTDSSFSGDSSYKIGCKCITVDLKDINNSLKKSCFKDRYLLILADDVWSDMPWGGQGHLIRKILLQNAHALFCANPSTINWVSGQGDMTPQQFADEFGSIKACLHGSDAHRVDKICRPDLDRFCWIKADPSFEGLKQVIYEPVERVRIQPGNPDEEHRKLYISSVSFEESTNFPIPSGTQIPLNKDLVAIIGGRGSGKSALAECIGYCFDRHAKDPVNGKDRFIPYFAKNDGSVHIKVCLGDRDGKESVDARRVGCDDPSSSFPFEYLGQNRIEEYAMDDNRIHDLISAVASKSSARFASYRDLLDRITSLENELVDTIERRNEIAVRLDAIDLASVHIEKTRKETEYRLLSSDTTREILNALADASKQKRQASGLLEDITECQRELQTFENDMTERLMHISQKASVLNIEWDAPVVDVSSVTLALGLLASDNRFVAIEEEYNARISESKALPEGANISAEHVSTLTSEVRRLEKTIENHAVLAQEFGYVRERCVQLYMNVISRYEELRQAYQNVLDDFLNQDSSRDILGDLILTAHVAFDVDGLYRELFEAVDRRKCRSLEALRERYGFGTAEQFVEFLRTSVDSPDTYEPFLDSAKGGVLRTFLKTRMKLHTKVELRLPRGPVSLDHLSLGQKGTVVLKLFLATGNCPIVFDQPEDHLDNEFIFEVLVPTFLRAKKRRQVIVVTHNANLVVNGDAEQVIVADFSEEGSIRYDSGSIEERRIRDRITNVLEGGADAFAKRERKLNLEG